MSAAFYDLANQRLSALATADAGPVRAREHMADLVRTRITPGADPRVGWHNGDPPALSPSGRGRSRRRLSVLVEWSTSSGLSRGLTKFYELAPVGWLYVPYDVARWRSTKHRAELTRRARELAAATRRAMGGTK